MTEQPGSQPTPREQIAIELIARFPWNDGPGWDGMIERDREAWRLMADYVLEREARLRAVSAGERGVIDAARAWRHPKSPPGQDETELALAAAIDALDAASPEPTP